MSKGRLEQEMNRDTLKRKYMKYKRLIKFPFPFLPTLTFQSLLRCFVGKQGKYCNGRRMNDSLSGNSQSEEYGM